MDSICRYIAMFGVQHSVEDMIITCMWSIHVTQRPSKTYITAQSGGLWTITTKSAVDIGYIYSMGQSTRLVLDLHDDIYSISSIFVFCTTKLGNKMPRQSYFCQDDRCYHQFRTQIRFLYTMATWGLLYWRIVHILHEEWSIIYNLLRSKFGKLILYYSNSLECNSALTSQ